LKGAGLARYLVALGSNVRHRRHGPPARIVAAAVRALNGGDLAVTAVSGTMRSRPVGPSAREYANAAVVLEASLDPPELLARLKALERSFGRRRGGPRWGPRVLDCDIVLWSEGRFIGSDLRVPHREYEWREFVLGPAAEIAGDWRDPVSGRTVRQARARLTRPRPVPRSRRSRAGP
jgi:2-amino-4-hydroxy-6-hydroxymethyldihydropteridine diphosphokinase